MADVEVCWPSAVCVRCVCRLDVQRAPWYRRPPDAHASHLHRRRLCMRALQRRQVRRYAPRCHNTVPHLPDYTACPAPAGPAHPRHSTPHCTRCTHTPAQSAHLAPASRNHHCPLPSALRPPYHQHTLATRVRPRRVIAALHPICLPAWAAALPAREPLRPTPDSCARTRRPPEGGQRARSEAPARPRPPASTAPAPPSDRNTRSRQPWPRPRPPGRLPSPAFEKAARAPIPTAATHANASSHSARLLCHPAPNPRLAARHA